MIFLWLVMVTLYYFVVMRERKGDIFYDSNRKRIKCSLLIQLLGMLGVILILALLPSSQEEEWAGNSKSGSKTEVIMPSKPHTNGIQGYWEAV